MPYLHVAPGVKHWDVFQHPSSSSPNSKKINIRPLKNNQNKDLKAAYSVTMNIFRKK